MKKSKDTLKRVVPDGTISEAIVCFIPSTKRLATIFPKGILIYDTDANTMFYGNGTVPGGISMTGV